MSAPVLPTTIDEVIARLQQIIQDSIREKNRIGYFAALYLRVTMRIREGILEKEFEDNPRMEKLDVIFANRFISAYDQWKEHAEPTQSWKTTFLFTRKRGIVLQHLLLGMNAHINLDLGIAASEVCAGNDLIQLKKDFNAINAILGSLSKTVINQINQVSPFFSFIGFHANNTNSFLVQFSLTFARDGAWSFAEDIHTMQGEARQTAIRERDKVISKIGENIAHQKGAMLRFTLFIIRLFEWRNPAKIIRALEPVQKRKFSAKELV